MKTTTKIILGVGAIAAVFAYMHDRGRADERQLELVLTEVGRDVTCTRSAVDGQDWMACRYAEDDQGPAWIRVGERDERPLWAPANGTASRALERYLATASPERQAKLAQVRAREPGDGAPSGVPWARLE